MRTSTQKPLSSCFGCLILMVMFVAVVIGTLWLIAETQRYGKQQIDSIKHGK